MSTAGTIAGEVPKLGLRASSFGTNLSRCLGSEVVCSTARAILAMHHHRYLRHSSAQSQPVETHACAYSSIGGIRADSAPGANSPSMRMLSAPGVMRHDTLCRMLSSSSTLVQPLMVSALAPVVTPTPGRRERMLGPAPHTVTRAVEALMTAGARKIRKQQ